MFLSLTARPKRRHHRPEMSRKRYPVRIPRYASGIRAQEPRGGAGRSWWARRWTERLEAMGLGPRLGRGRHYAVSGQVVEMRMEGPLVTAKVVGTRPDPYTVTVAFRTPEGEARSRIVSAIASEPMLAARIMADDLPTEVEGFFRAEGLDLFPGGRLPDDPADAPGRRRYDVTTSCSCPDYANPCKHASAVLLILGEEISRRPSALLELRGIGLEELCGEE